MAEHAPGRVPLPAAPAGYEIIAELGIGGMGAVYLAREVIPDRLVAIKFLRRPGSQSAYDRFLVEVRALGALDHPNIIRVLSTDFFRSDPYFTTEYFPSGSLLKRVEESGPFDPIEAARIMATAARAVYAANQKDVIHRDLKPSNILLTADGVPKVADFGLAKRLDREDDLTTATGALGSPPYMAPEQTGQYGVESVDARTDVYGLGATLYHLVTGRRPFVGDTPEQVIGRVLIDPPPRPRSVRPELPRELEAIILKCLEKDPSRRYPSGEALAVDLDRFLAGRPPEAPLLTWPRRMGQWVRRNRKHFAIAGALCLFAIVGVAAWFALTPANPLKEFEGRLRAGKPVTLIGETGLPRWHRWAFGSPALEESHTAGGACAFESIQSSLLELLPDPWLDRYRVTADLQLLRLRYAGEGNADFAPNNFVGLYFAQSTMVASDGVPVHTFLAVSFNDHLDPRAKKAGISQASARALTVALIPRADADAIEITGSASPPIRFTPVELPGQRRRVRIEVTPQGVRFFWATAPGGAFELLAELSTTDLNRLLLELNVNLQIQRPGVIIPDWRPRMPLGIWSRGAAVAVRNVVIEPLPPSQ